MIKLLDENIELLKKDHLIVKDMFNSYWITRDFTKVLYLLSEGIGYGGDQIGFTFWNDLDEYSKTFYNKEFNGVEIYYIDDELIIDYESLFYYIKIAVDNYLNVYPDDKNKINNMLYKIKDRFKIK